jgi:hypothetical protein
MKKILSAFLVVLSTSLQAETYIQLNGTSLHDRPGYNQLNYGAGIEKTVTENWNVAAGWYRNSEYRGSGYAYARYSFYKDGAWDLGVGVGAVTGYKRTAVIPMAFPEVCYNYLCGLFLPQVEPTGTSVLGFHLRVPI